MHVTQPLGFESLVTLRVGEANLSVCIFDSGSDLPSTGDSTWVHYDPSRMYLYGPNGQSLKVDANALTPDTT